MLRISKKYQVVLTVHDSIVCCVPDAEVAEAQAFVESCMRWTPDWAEGLPVDCDSGTGKSYGCIPKALLTQSWRVCTICLQGTLAV